MTVKAYPELPEAHVFFKTLYPEIPKWARLLLWRKDKKKTSLFSSITEAVNFASEYGTEADVYYELALSPPGVPDHRRAAAGEVVALPGLVVDFDLQTRDRKKSVFPTAKDLDDFIEQLAFKPTMVVNSGAGRHIYWLFNEPWDIRTDEEREIAADFSYGWFKYVEERCPFAVDPTWSLDRLWRIPGTVNAKRQGQPLKVEIVSRDTTIRYEPDDHFSPFARRPSASDVEITRDHAQRALAKIQIKATAEVPKEVLNLIATQKDFAMIWHRKKRMPSDQSSSGYDMALANQLVMAGLNNQKVADALVSNRRINDSELKLREDYYARTILKARASLGMKADDLLEIGHDDVSAEVSTIRQFTGLPVVAIDRFGAPHPSKVRYEAELADGQIVTLGTLKDALKQAHWRKLTLLYRPEALPEKSTPAKTWNPRIEKALAGASATIDPEDQDSLELCKVVLDYGHTQGAPSLDKSPDKKFEFIKQMRPFIFEGHLYVYGLSFYQWLRDNRLMNDLSRAEVLRALKTELLFYRKRVSARKKGEVKTRHYYVGPITYLNKVMEGDLDNDEEGNDES